MERELLSFDGSQGDLLKLRSIITMSSILVLVGWYTLPGVSEFGYLSSCREGRLSLRGYNNSLSWETY